MSPWQFNVLFFTGVGGAIFLLIAPVLGFENVPNNPGAVTGVGTILAFVLTQKSSLMKANQKSSDPPPVPPRPTSSEEDENRVA